METKTKVLAEDGKQELKIVREFGLPVELLFKAYTEPTILEQWMGTKVIKLENKNHGSWHFETTDPKGNTFGMNGTIHTIIPNKKIIRTFEMDNMPFDAQLEFFDFESLTENRSKLTMHQIFRSLDHRDQLLKMPFAFGINMAHNRLESIVSNLK